MSRPVPRMYVKPAPGKHVVWPAGSPKQFRAIPADGCWVPEDPYFHGRINDGGLVRCEAPPVPVEPPAAPAKKGKE